MRLTKAKGYKFGFQGMIVANYNVVELQPVLLRV